MRQEFYTINVSSDDDSLCEKGCIFNCKCGVIHDEYYYCLMHLDIKNISA